MKYNPKQGHGSKAALLVTNVDVVNYHGLLPTVCHYCIVAHMIIILCTCIHAARVKPCTCYADLKEASSLELNTRSRRVEASSWKKFWNRITPLHACAVGIIPDILYSNYPKIGMVTIIVFI